jgi:hypothetical protein
MIVIGDIHGSYDGLREVLFQANVTSSADLDTICEWQEQSDTGTVVLQIGDMVDRGPGAVRQRHATILHLINPNISTNVNISIAW